LFGLKAARKVEAVDDAAKASRPSCTPTGDRV
jgi:hypothetical protein